MAAFPRSRAYASSSKTTPALCSVCPALAWQARFLWVAWVSDKSEGHGRIDWSDGESNVFAQLLCAMECVELLVLCWTEMYSDIIISKQHQTYELGMKPQICVVTHQPTCIIKAYFVDSFQRLNTANCWISLKKMSPQRLDCRTRVERTRHQVRLSGCTWRSTSHPLETWHNISLRRDATIGKGGRLENLKLYVFISKRSQSFFRWCTFLTIHVLQNGFRGLWHFCDTCT